MGIHGFQNIEAFKAYLMQEYNYPFMGWDFAHIRDRFTTSPLPWSYPTKVLHVMHTHKITRMLDMGTGGGEYLRDNFQPFPPNTYATEAYAPNVPIARQNLELLGVNVIEICEGDSLPFSDGEFELVINQHEYYDPNEVARILQSGGRFITKQVDGTNDDDVKNLLGVQSKDPPWNLQVASQGLRNCDFHIQDGLSFNMKTRLFDIGALVYYLKIAPWVIPHFHPESYLEELAKIHNRISKEGYMDLLTPRFFISAIKP